VELVVSAASVAIYSSPVGPHLQFSRTVIRWHAVFLLVPACARFRRRGGDSRRLFGDRIGARHGPELDCPFGFHPVVVKFGALVFIVFVPLQYAIQLQLLSRSRTAQQISGSAVNQGCLGSSERMSTE
jgi:hypothetical protein